MWSTISVRCLDRHRFDRLYQLKEWIGFDSDQQWEMLRLAPTGRLVTARYAVNELRPMLGALPL
jgi:hypothetical protein